MGKTRDLFKEIRDIKGTFHVNMGTIKDRNGMDLTEAEDIRRGDKNIQKNYIQISNIDISLFQILKDDAVKVLHSLCQQIWKTQQWSQDWKRIAFQPQRKTMPKNAPTTSQLHSSHMLVK